MDAFETTSCRAWSRFMDLAFDDSLDPCVLAGLRAMFAALLSALVGEDGSLDPGLPEDHDCHEFVTDCAIYSALVRLEERPETAFADALCEVIRSSWDSPQGPAPWLAGFCEMWDWRMFGIHGPLGVRVWREKGGLIKLGFRLRQDSRLADDRIREPVDRRGSGTVRGGPGRRPSVKLRTLTCIPGAHPPQCVLSGCPVSAPPDENS